MCQKFGVTGQPIPCTRLLGKMADVGKQPGFRVRSFYLIIVNDEAGTFTTATIVEGKLGRAYDPAKHTYPLTDANESTWAKKHYHTYPAERFDVVQLIPMPVPAEEQDKTATVAV